jgi:signal transduction histidine kinase
LTGRLIVTGLAFITFFLSVFLPIRDIHYFPAHPLRANFQNPLSAGVPKTLPAPSPKRFIFSKHLSEDQVKMLVLHLTLNSTLLFGLVLVFVLLLVNALLSERQSRQKLALANDKLRQYALRIEDQATLQERNRIAREIHDSLGHSLTAQSIQLENASMFLPSNIDKAQAFLKEAKRLGSNALREVRQSVAVLRYDPLQGQSLEQAIASLVKDFHRTTGIVPNCRICLSSPLLSDVSIAIYRIVQEALTNIHKHSGATQVIVHLQTKLATVYLLVEDNGRGFKPEQNTTGFGLQGMRERTLALGGQFEIDSAQEVGCRITASFPLAKDSIIKYPKSR